MSILLETKGLTAAAEDKELLHGVDIVIGEGETHVLMGQNGAGKSTLGYRYGQPRVHRHRREDTL